MFKRDFVCHREGFANKKIVEFSKEQRNRSSSRCGCLALMRMTLKKSNGIFPEEWHVTQYKSEHNHELLLPIQVRFLPAYRTISKEDEKQLLLYKDAGLTVKQIMRVMEFQKNVRHGDLSFLHRVNSYDMPFAIFIGIDNHGRTILFGCALFRDETFATFQWLMKTFVKLMKKSPKTIISDQDQWMTRAILMEMPFTKHAFCIWHITSKFSGWFTVLLRDQYSYWCAEFYRLYRLDNIDDFEQKWPLVISKFNLQENKHVCGLYKIKRSWVPAYLRNFFFGGISTTGRCESIKIFVKRFTSSRSCLTRLVEQVNLAIEDVGQTHLHYIMLDTYRGSSLRTLSPF
ncbi:hypothetical protein RND81_06G064200 [Saponaria officinalis]|uniref:Protein FAR1-RELATED SEQUENCE n=1 Tax=Saponaria officinalis TaxID=3572 RepID=A0AAW1K870_SAPOF